MDNFTVIMWMGWRTDFASLRSAGWEITRKESYDNPRDRANSALSGEYIYLRHAGTRMIARLDSNSRFDQSGVWEVDFLTHERNGRKKPHPVYMQKSLSEEDVGYLLESVLKIQSKRQRRRKPKEILEYKPVSQRLRA